MNKNEILLDLAHFWANNYTERKLLQLLRLRNGNPNPDWDEDDLEAFHELRKTLEMALAIKRAKKC